MELKLLDYEGNPHIFEIGDIDDIGAIIILVVTGDEIAVVIYKDYQYKSFDSGRNRLTDWFDTEYYIYRCGSSENLIDDPEFQNRRSSDW